MNKPRILLSPPHMGPDELDLMRNAFESNWIAPLGPHVDGFEHDFADYVGAPHAVALSSGTAALHLALLCAGVGTGDEVLVSTLTFSATVNPIRYLGARPVLIDSEPRTWNIDPNLLAETLRARAIRGRLPRAVVPVHLYGQCADLDAIISVCAEYEVPVIEDAAEALGSSYKGRHPGTFGKAGIFSFNGNKIITTSGGGMLVTPDSGLAFQARKLSTQAREPAPHYEHREVGYNYRLSNILAAIGRGQLRVLEERVLARRGIHTRYANELSSWPGVSMMPEELFGHEESRANRWLTCLTVDSTVAGYSSEDLRLALEADGIESRPVWKPMHLQPVFSDCSFVGGDVAARLFKNGLCLPSGSSMTKAEQDSVIAVMRRVREKAEGSFA